MSVANTLAYYGTGYITAVKILLNKTLRPTPFTKKLSSPSGQKFEKLFFENLRVNAIKLFSYLETQENSLVRLPLAISLA